MSGTVDEALVAARALGVARGDALVLLGHRLQRPRIWLMAHGDAALSPAQWAQCQHDWAQRAQQVPVAYLVGRHEFHGLMLEVNPAVLDPRPDTETLVDWALECFGQQPCPAVLDLGTGSGAVALALAHALQRHRHPPQVWATDLSAAALAVARRNAANLGLALNLRQGAWFEAVTGQRFGLVVSNPPYLAADDPHLHDLRHEPRSALVAGHDGLADLQAIASGAPQHLEPGGWLLLEHGHTQGPAVAALLQAHGFTDVTHRHDLAGHVRCTGGRLCR